MTELREQLLAARDEYRSIRYPGDLSADVLAARPRGAATHRGEARGGSAVRMFLFRVAGGAIAAAAVVAVVVLRPPAQPPVGVGEPTVAGPIRPVRPVRVAQQQRAWRFPPDLTFASEAAERVKTAAARVQMRMTLPYRDLRMPIMPELPDLPWPAWSGGGEKTGDPNDLDPRNGSPAPAPSTQQAA
jgi:hypothetical protein